MKLIVAEAKDSFLNHIHVAMQRLDLLISVAADNVPHGVVCSSFNAS